MLGERLVGNGAIPVNTGGQEGRGRGSGRNVGNQHLFERQDAILQQ